VSIIAHVEGIICSRYVLTAKEKHLASQRESEEKEEQPTPARCGKNRSEMGLFDSLVDLGKDVFDIVKAPVEIAVDVTGAVVKPVADTAREVVADIKEDINEEN